MRFLTPMAGSLNVIINDSSHAPSLSGSEYSVDVLCRRASELASCLDELRGLVNMLSDAIDRVETSLATTQGYLLNGSSDTRQLRLNISNVVNKLDETAVINIADVVLDVFKDASKLVSVLVAVSDSLVFTKSVDCDACEHVIRQLGTVASGSVLFDTRCSELVLVIEDVKRVRLLLDNLLKSLEQSQ